MSTPTTIVQLEFELGKVQLEFKLGEVQLDLELGEVQLDPELGEVQLDPELEKKDRSTMDPIVQRAVKALKIDVPVMAATVKGNTVTLWLYGRNAPVKWRLRRKPSRSKGPKPKKE